MHKKIFLILILILAGILIYSIKLQSKLNPTSSVFQQNIQTEPLSIETMRIKDYPGSDLVIEETLEDRENFHQYIASYKSEDLKIYGLLTIPISGNNFPVIIFNHGYIPPTRYRTIERYVSYVDAFAKNGYIVFKPDYRGNGDSEGQPEGAYYSPAYTADVLNALASIKRYKDVNPNRIGMWGHSMGGNITLRSLVVRPNDIMAAVIWGGVVGTYDDLMNNWQRRVSFQPPPNELMLRNKYRSELLSKHGKPADNPTFWHSIDPNFYLSDISAPIQIQVGLADEEVPWQFSEGLKNRLEKVGKKVEFYTYEGDNHNLSINLDVALQRSVDFFDKYLK